MPQITPLMKQYLNVKAQHADAILFFRVGDFYEMFYDDAVTASSILQITLTSRDKNKTDPVPLCGIPYHAAATYIAKLVRTGKSVAICEQVEDPSTAKGIVKREVVRVITPGTVIEPELLSAKDNNYLAALLWERRSGLEGAKHVGLACLDLSTGDFRMLASDLPWTEVEGELMKIAPKELLLSSVYRDEGTDFASLLPTCPIRFVSRDFFQAEAAQDCLKAHFHFSSLAFLGDGRLSLAAAGALLAHLQQTQKMALGNIVSLQPIRPEGFLRIDSLALRHLDLIPLSGDQKGRSLFHLLDETMTAMGGRLLKEWIVRPLLASEDIRKRQAGVAFFYDHLSVRTGLRNRLKGVVDIQRLIGRISLGAAQPRDLIGLKTAVARLPELEKEMLGVAAGPAGRPHPDLISELLGAWDNLEPVYRLIDDAIVPDPPFSVKEGGVIRSGYLDTLDALRDFQRKGRSMLTEIETKERCRTGIESLKVRYNRVFGYYIEVSGSHLEKVPVDYIRKQTLTRAERFTTPELNALEARLSGNQEAIKTLEESVFEAVRTKLSSYAGCVLTMSKKIAELDLLAGLAETAHRNNYCRPEVNEDAGIHIVEGRHPVLEQEGYGTKGAFIPNDARLSSPEARLLILTGPNMAGKSTYMRQIALIVLMAQMGSFVPAREASIGVVDQVFTRVGAQDALTEGMSTFMVEMCEMAKILRMASSRSLILLDEIGRGTSTFDGISIAWAIAEYVHDTVKARTLFATHYHELTGLAAIHEGIENYHVLVREWGEEIVFLRKMVPGGSDKSYGIQVGRLAGLPPEIVDRSKAVLKALEEKAMGSPLSTQLANAAVSNPTGQGDLFSPVLPGAGAPIRERWPEHPVIESLREIDPNRLTPIEALQILAELSERAKPSSTS
ncbi:MAG: DNA mismatch repair protein MutS [Nitrospiria bacterium]